MTAEAALIAQIQTLLSAGFVIFLRVGAMLAVMPAFGDQSVPMRVRLGAAFAFAAVVLPMVPVPPDPPPLPYLVLAESVIGLALGLGLRLLIIALQTAGSIAAQATSLSQFLGGASAEPMPAIGQVLMIAGLALAVMSDLHLRVIELVIRSYDVFPIGVFPDPRDLGAWGIAGVARAFSLAFQLAAPFVILSVLYNLTLGFINRAMPQLMVAFVGAPVISLGGLALLAISAPVILHTWIGFVTGYLSDPLTQLP